MIRDLVLKNRSYRRFYQETKIGLETLKELVDLARLSASGGNSQALKFILSCDSERNALIFPHLGFARQPDEGERPSAYIIILGDTRIRESFGCNHGIAAQSILLGAVERGLGGCMIARIKLDGLRQSLAIAPHYEILLAIALGKPKEAVVIEAVAQDGSVKMSWDSEGVHHVPKRPLDDIIVG